MSEAYHFKEGDRVSYLGGGSGATAYRDAFILYGKILSIHDDEANVLFDNREEPTVIYLDMLFLLTDKKLYE